MFLSTGCSLLRAEGFSCSLGVVYGGLGISKLQFLIKKIEIKFPAINLFQFKVMKPGISYYKKCWIRIRIRIKSMRIRNPDLNIYGTQGTIKHGIMTVYLKSSKEQLLQYLIFKFWF